MSPNSRTRYLSIWYFSPFSHGRSTAAFPMREALVSLFSDHRPRSSLASAGGVGRDRRDRVDWSPVFNWRRLSGAVFARRNAVTEARQVENRLFKGIAMTVNQFGHVYQFRIDLRGVKPPIWRRVQVPDNYTFEALHVVIQDLMDWTVYAGASYEFHVINHSTGLADAITCSCFGSSGFAGTNRPVTRIADYFTVPKTRAVYTCISGSKWDFTLRFEKQIPADPLEIYPICTKGKRASPPQDCAGSKEYERMLASVTDTCSGRSDDSLESAQHILEDDFDPEYFDCDNVFFTGGSGNPPLPDDLPERLLKILK